MKRARPLGIAAALAILAGCGDGRSAFERGMAAFEAGDMRTARVEFLNAAQDEPSNAAVRVMQARIQLANGDGVAAESEIARARTLGVPEASTRHLVAHARLLQDDPEGALAAASSVPLQHRAYASSIRGRAYMEMGQPEAARAEFNLALRLAPDDGRIWNDVASFRRSQGDIGGAIEAADRAVAARPRNVEALLLRAELTRGQYGLAASLPWFDRALEVDPSFVDARLERAITLGEMGRVRDMLADLGHVQGATGGHRLAYYLQALIAARAGNFALAHSIYGRTAGAFDSTPAGMLLEGAIQFGLGNPQAAVGRLEPLLAAQPTNRRARRLLAAAHWQLGEANEVVAVLAPLVDRPDADTYSLSLAGRAMARLGRAGESALLLARAARPVPEALSAIEPVSPSELTQLRARADAAPDNGPLQVRLVAGLIGLGESDEALRRALRLQEAAPGAPESHILAGDAFGAVGEHRRAAEQYRRAANIAFTEEVAMRLVGALQRAGEAEAASQVLGLHLRQNPRSIPSQLLYAAQAMQNGDWPLAIEVYESLRSRLGDNDATILNNLAIAYGQTGDYASAIPLARRAWALDRHNPATADTLGWLLFHSGTDRLNGLALLQRAAQGVPSDADIARRLARSQATGPVRVAGR